jgi:hypothetical protein
MSPVAKGKRRFARIRRGERFVARAVLLILLGVYTLIFTGLPDHLDSETEYQTVSALGRGQGFSLGGTPESDALVAIRAAQPENKSIPVRVGPGGGTYSWFGTGQALVALPLYWMGRTYSALAPGADDIEAEFAKRTVSGVGRSEYFGHLFVGWRNPLMGALCGWLVVLCASRLGLSRIVAFGAGLTYGLATFAMPQARSTLSDVQATTLLLGAFYLILTVRETLERGRNPTSHHLVFAGLCLGLAFLTRLVTAPAVFVLVVAMSWVLLHGHKQLAMMRRDPGQESGGPVRDLLLFCVPAAAGLLAFLILNWVRFGDALESGYGAAVQIDGFWQYPPLLGLLGLLVSPGKGLVFLAPALLLAPRGWLLAEGRVSRFYRWVTLAMVVAVFGPIVGAETWHGAWTYGPRYVLPALPFLWLGVAIAMERMRLTLLGRVTILLLVVMGLATNVPGVLVDHMTHQDLAVQSARHDWPDADIGVPGGSTAGENVRFQNIQWSVLHAAPWAHWRILRHRLAGLGEQFDSREIFYTDESHLLVPDPESRPGFGHLGWYDYSTNLGGPLWPLGLAVCLLFGAAMRLLVRSPDY